MPTRGAVECQDISTIKGERKVEHRTYGLNDAEDAREDVPTSSSRYSLEQLGDEGVAAILWLSIAAWLLSLGKFYLFALEGLIWDHA